MMETSLPRRRFLQGALAAGVCGTRFSLAQTPAPTESWVLLGSQGPGIYRARWNSRTGTLGSPELAVSTPKPTYLALHPTLPVVYACNEGEGDAAAVSAFTLDRTSATLTALGPPRASHGDAPCFVSVDATGKLLFAANYGGGSLAAFPLDSTGIPAEAASTFSCKESGLCGTPGPVHDRQNGPHLHCATLSPGNHFVLACDLGDDAILAFPLQPGAGPDTAPLGPVQRLPARLGSGPRHLAFHPNGRWLYCIHELDFTVDLYRWSSAGGAANAQLVPQSTVTLATSAEAPAGKTNTGAEVVISRDGRFLYASTRGIDRLSVFRIDRTTGMLHLVQQIPCGGQTPRFFALDPTERWLVCANQDGNNVTVFVRDARAGTLTAHGAQPLATPQCVVWL